jgi:cytochrome c551/c552
MTLAERELVGRWIKQGAPAPGSSNAPPAATPAAAEPASSKKPDAAARDYFQKKCMVCHGPAGNGDGPAAASLAPKPRKFSDASWQASVTDEHLAKVIVSGGGAVGKSTAMPANPELAKQPEILSELVRLVRSFGG